MTYLFNDHVVSSAGADICEDIAAEHRHLFGRLDQDSRQVGIILVVDLEIYKRTYFSTEITPSYTCSDMAVTCNYMTKSLSPEAYSIYPCN